MTPTWDAPSMVAVIGAVSTALVIIIGSVGAAVALAITAWRRTAETHAAIEANTQLTRDTHAQGVEIKELVNGNTHVLKQDNQTLRLALDATHDEIRGLKALVAALTGPPSQ